MKTLHRIICLAVLTGIGFSSFARELKTPARMYYQLKVYRLKTAEQVSRTDSFLRDAYLPALHRYGIAAIGVYHFIGNDTAAEKTIHVLIPLRGATQLQEIEDRLAKDAAYQSAGTAYLNTAFDAPAYSRIESILLYAFPMMPRYKTPALKGDPSERIYELRSYESATEELNRQKVHMFNEGGEVTLFERLGFNAVFYAEVLAGSRMPNLMYMTSFDNRASRDAHWKTFGADPEWKKLSALPQYRNTVSRSEIILLHPAPFSEL